MSMGLMGAYTADDYLTRDELRELPVPEPLGPWHQPVGFGEFVDLIDDELRRQGLMVAREEHYVIAKGNRHFGVMAVAGMDGVLGGAGWQMMIGMKGAHDQSGGRGLVFGRHVGVCSNGMFSGDLAKLMTKQTSHIWERLREFVRRGVGNIVPFWQAELARVEARQQLLLPREVGDQALVDIHRAGGLSAQQLGVALREWVEPTFGEHAEHGASAWLLEQSVTQALKPTGSRPANPTLIEHHTRVANRVIEKLAA